MRTPRLIAAFVLAAVAVPLAATAGEPPDDTATVTVGDDGTIWGAAVELCPHAPFPMFQGIYAANRWLSDPDFDPRSDVWPGTVLFFHPSDCPGGASSTTTTSTSLASTTVPTTLPQSTLPSTTSSTVSVTTTSTTVTPASTTIPSPGLTFPTPDDTGPRDACTDPEVITGTVTSSFHGQVFDCVVIHGNLRIQHNGVHVVDTRIVGVATYMIHVRRLGNSASQPCPTGVRVEYTEVDGSQTQADHIPVYALCGATFDHLYVHGGGLGFRLVSNSVVSNSYVHADRREFDGQHRTTLSMHGGVNNQVIHNTLTCERPADVSSGSGGCSAALSVYGDFALPDGFLAQNNLLTTSGGYCMYGGQGHPDSNAFPDGVNIDIIGNHFSTRFNPLCGIFGAVTAVEAIGQRGNECHGNVWHESGEPMTERNCT